MIPFPLFSYVGPMAVWDLGLPSLCSAFAATFAATFALYTAQPPWAEAMLSCYPVATCVEAEDENICPGAVSAKVAAKPK